MTKVSAVYRINFIQRTKIARKASGLKVKAIASALGMSPSEYRIYETVEMLPFSMVVGFSVMTRVSLRYMMTGDREGITEAVRTQSFNGIIVPLNKCGAPCPFGPEWCHLQCIPPTE